MRALLIASFAAILSLPLSAATRLTYAMSDRAVPVEWAASSFPIHYQMDRRVANVLTPALVDRAFSVWSSIPETTIRFQSDGIVDSSKAGYDGKNTVTMMDDLFKDQRALAITSNWYDGNGRLTEVDIQVDPAMAATTTYNMQQAVAHEVGHLLGLDHSAVISAVMFPYVSRGNEALHLDSDDRIAMGSMYPRQTQDLVGGILKGRVTGDGAGVFAAQVVAVNAQGEPVATALTNSTGDFELKGIPAGEYRIYAEPLDGPVDTRNLAGVWRDAKVKSFPTEFLSGRTTVQSGGVVGNLILDTSGPPVQLNPRWVGVTAVNGSIFSLTSTSVAIQQGQTVSIAVAGDGILAGSTFEVMNPGIRRVSDFRYAANYVYANFEIGSASVPGSAVIMVHNGQQNAALTGALRVQGTAPGGRQRIVKRG